MAPILLIAIIFRTMEAFKTFDLAYVMTGQPTTELISIRLYKMAFQEWQTGKSCALAYIMLIMVLASPTSTSNTSTRRRSAEMAIVTSRGQRIGNRIAIAAIIVALIVFLAPIYWIRSTAFKPRNLATTIPPTIVFKPEISPFVKLFTKRSQLREQPSQEVFDAAPWWEQLVFDGGEKWFGPARARFSFRAIRSRFLNSLIIAITSTILAVSMGTITAYGFSRFKVKGEPDLLFFILSTRMLPPSWSPSRCS